MLPLLLGAIVLAPPYWLLVPARYHRTAITVASLAALAACDRRLLGLVLGVAAALFGLTQAIGGAEPRRARTLTATGLAALVALFAWNKLSAPGHGVLPSQSGIVLVGVSYLVLRAAAVLFDSLQGTLGDAGFGELLAWIAFLPTYPAGPIEEFQHFRGQHASFEGARMLRGLERILFGLVKALLLGHYVGEWAASVMSEPAAHERATLLLGLYAFTLRFYLDFAGYSDVAIGLGALFGYEIQENFDRPLVQRNLVLLWQRWHMTLTRWLRTYVFIPLSRSLMRREWGERTSVAAGQVGAMALCGLWHGIGWNFLVWGLWQACGLVWTGIAARELGSRLPPGVVSWWRTSRLANALSTFLTFNVFALSLAFVYSDLRSGVAYLFQLLAP